MSYSAAARYDHGTSPAPRAYGPGLEVAPVPAQPRPWPLLAAAVPAEVETAASARMEDQ